jgi:peptidoglycan hydrolase-like protein with peptidoglycan-binding domain
MATLIQGSVGQEVKNLQTALNYHLPNAAPPLKVDGIFGPRTRERVLQFQNKHQLKPMALSGRRRTAPSIVSSALMRTCLLQVTDRMIAHRALWRSGMLRLPRYCRRFRGCNCSFLSHFGHRPSCSRRGWRSIQGFCSWRARRSSNSKPDRRPASPPILERARPSAKWCCFPTYLERSGVSLWQARQNLRRGRSDRRTPGQTRCAYRSARLCFHESRGGGHSQDRSTRSLQTRGGGEGVRQAWG